MDDIFITGMGGEPDTPRPAQEAPDSLQSKSYAKVLDLLAEGQWEEVGVGGLKGIYLDQVPIQNKNGTFNFADVKVETRLGTADQTRMALAATTEAITAVGVEVLQSTPIERTVSGESVDIIRATISIPSLSSRNPTTGDLTGAEVEFKIEYNSADDATWRTVSDATRRYKWVDQPTQESYTGGEAYEVNFTLTPGTYTVEVPGSDSGTPIEVTGNNSTTFVVELSLNNGSTWLPFWAGTYSKTMTLSKVFRTDPANIVKFRTSVYDPPSPPSNWGNIISGSVAQGVVRSSVAYYEPTHKVIGKAASAYEKQVSFRVTGDSPYIVRVTRITPDSTSELLQNKTEFTALAAVTEEKFRYPYSVLAGINVDAAQFPSVPTRAYDCKMSIVKVPVNYDPITRVYTGVWNGTFKEAWTDNPAWCFYDLITHPRRGLGDRIPAALVDKFALYSIGQYCDELVTNWDGTTEPRFTCNVLIQSEKEAYKVIQDMASVFRGITYWGSGAVVPVQDSPKSVHYVFNNTNVLNGDFTYQSSDESTRYNAVNVTYNDPKNFYRQNVVYVDDTDAIAEMGYLNVANITAFGCTSEHMARRVGRWLLYTNTYETDVVTFITGAEGAIPLPGSIIGVADTLRAETRLGGRVVSVVGTTVTLDAAITFDGGTDYSISVVDTDGAVQSSTFNAVGAQSVITLDTIFAGTVTQDSVFVITDVEVPEVLFRVISVTEKAPLQYEVAAVSYDPEKYNYVEKYRAVPQAPTTTSFIHPPTNLQLQEIVYISGKSSASKIVASWTAAKYGASYKVAITDGSRATTTFSTKDTSYEFLELPIGTYVVEVSAISVLGDKSQVASKTITLVGKTTNPSDVSAVSVEVIPASGLVLKWQPISDADVAGYALKTADTGWTNGGVSLFEGDATSATVLPTLGSTTYYVRAYDNKGIFSTNSASNTFVTTAPVGPSAIMHAFADTSTTVSTVTFKWDEPYSQFLLKYYKVTLTKPSGPPVVSEVNTTEWTTQADWVGSATLSVVAVNIFGWESSTSNYVVQKFLPGSVTNFVAQVVDNNVLLYWDLPTKTSLPIDHVKIKRGTTWAGATEVGIKSGSFTTIFETEAGLFTYWAAVVDTDNNEGAPVAISAVVNEPPDYVLNADIDSGFGGTTSNGVLSQGKFYFPVNTTETWQQHFVNNSWTTPQAQVTAGFPLYIQPTLNSGYYEEVMDLGTVLSGSKITVAYSGEAIGAGVTISVDISTSADNVSYTAFPNSSSIYGTNFRYVKVRVNVNTAADGLGLYRIDALNVRVDTKLKNDVGDVNCLASDTLGTVYNFGKEFLDVSGHPAVSPVGTAAVIATADFKDAVLTGTYSVTSNVITVNVTAHDLVVGQNVRLGISTGTAPVGVVTVATVPTANSFTAALTTANTSGNLSIYSQGCRVYLYNTSGTRVNGLASVSVKGN